MTINSFLIESVRLSNRLRERHNSKNWTLFYRQRLSPVKIISEAKRFSDQELLYRK